MNEVIEKYLTTLQKLKVAEKYLQDVKNLQALMKNYDENVAANTISGILLKYRAEFNYIGKNYTNYFVVKFQKNPQETYKEIKTEDDIFSDIDYVHNFLVMIIAAKLSLVSDLDSGITELLNNL